MAFTMPREIRWPPMLAVLGVGWVFATSLTACGMYMVACHANFSGNSANSDANQQPPRAKGEDGLYLRTPQFNRCGGKWTLSEGHQVLLIGSLLNMVLLMIMLALLMREKRSSTASIVNTQDSPPDYESLMKAETPPPSFSELHLDQHQDPLTAAPTTDPAPSHRENALPPSSKLSTAV